MFLFFAQSWKHLRKPHILIFQHQLPCHPNAHPDQSFKVNMQTVYIIVIIIDLKGTYMITYLYNYRTYQCKFIIVTECILYCISENCKDNWQFNCLDHPDCRNTTSSVLHFLKIARATETKTICWVHELCVDLSWFVQKYDN